MVTQQYIIRHLMNNTQILYYEVLSQWNCVLQEDNMTNGSSDVSEPSVKEEEGDGLVAKSRRKAPWVMNEKI